jgi:hypothetical protein
VGAIYINTDLELRARFELGPLNSELAEAGLTAIFSKYLHGVWESTYESGKHHHPSQAIDQMLDVVDRLSPVGRNLWNACISRRFNVGYEGSDEPYPWTDLRWTHTTWQFTAPMLQRMVSANSSFVVTFYPQQESKTEDSI